MKKTINKDIKKYCSEVKKLLACPGGIKFAFISELKNRIDRQIVVKKEKSGGSTASIIDLL